MNLTVKEAARLLQTTENTIYRWVHEGTIPSHRINDKFRLNRVELLEWATARGIKVSPEIFHPPLVGEEEPLPPKFLTAALRRGGILRDVGGVDTKGVLRAVCDRVELPAGVSRDDLFCVLMAREALGSTAIGNGIAIPHPRGPIILGVDQPAVTLVYLREGIDFGALDKQLVNTLFVIVSPSVRLHLNLLSHLMYALQDEVFQKMLKERLDVEQMAGQVEVVESALERQAGSSHGAAEKTT